MITKKFVITVSLLLLLFISLAGFIYWPPRPPQTNYQAELFQGISYTRLVRSTPRPLMIHIVTVDLTAPGINFLVTPGAPNLSRELSARTTGEFLEEFKLQVAINGGFFKPFHSRTPFDYYPHSGDPVDVEGLAISNGRAYSRNHLSWPKLCLTGQQAFIQEQICPAGTRQALAGKPLLVVEGRSIRPPSLATSQNLHPRTAVGVDKTGQTLWLVVVDGRQAGYSEGMTLAELADLMVGLGVDQGLNLDGGGSTTLVVAEQGQAQPLNAPYHTRLRMRQRPVANHLGVYALPLAP